VKAECVVRAYDELAIFFPHVMLLLFSLAPGFVEASTPDVFAVFR
jgi:hypothetical protein